MYEQATDIDKGSIDWCRFRVPLNKMLLVAGICLFVFTFNSYARYSSVINYNQTNGFPAVYSYNIFQDRQGYIWISTENGLARFNGYQFKLFTISDGLPDNEVFSLNEDRLGRLWFAPFTNNIGYIKDEQVHHRGNDSSLKNLRFKNRPNLVLFDKDGNSFFCERSSITCVSKSGLIYKAIISTNDLDEVLPYISESGRMMVMDSQRIFQYDKGQFIKVQQLVPYLRRVDITLNFWAISKMGIVKGTNFLKKAAEKNPAFFSSQAKNYYYLAPDKIAISRMDGCYLINMNTAEITDTLLFGYNVLWCIKSSDGSLWLGTQTYGLFKFMKSPINRLELPLSEKSVQYIKGTADGVQAVIGKNCYVHATFDQSDVLTLKDTTIISSVQHTSPVCYLKKESDDNWIMCSLDIVRIRGLNKMPLAKVDPRSCKDVCEEDKNNLLVATPNYLLRIDKSNFDNIDTLLVKRTTSVIKTGNTIYAGTLDGLWKGSTSAPIQQVFADIPSLSVHIVRLTTDTSGTVWVANNAGEITIIRENKIASVISSKNGLRCNRICAIKVGTLLTWVGTDNGLFAIQNAPPYSIVRHLTYAAGLNSSQVNCVDIVNGRVWVGTREGINYFDEQTVFQALPVLTLNVNSIINGSKPIIFLNEEMVVSQKSLAVDFDVIDHYGGQKPVFQYRLGSDSTWTTLENSHLFFPDLPYGKFTVSLRALSPNWLRPAQRDLHFYKSYPFYLQWWFITLVSLSIVACIAGGIIMFNKRIRKKDQEKLLIQRNLLQLEQLALQGQMNPHFIFNCITAIKQNYNAGDIEKANTFVDVFTALIRQTFEMIIETFVPLDKELNYLRQYLLVEQARFDHSFDFIIHKSISLPEAGIPVPAMMLQPLVENAIRHGIRHLSNADRRGKITMEVSQDANVVHIILSDNGVGRAKSQHFGRLLQQMQVTSTMVNAKRIDILNKLFNNQITHKTEDIVDAEGNVAGTRIIVSYPLNIQDEI